MKFRATGRDKTTGQPIEMVFEAANAQAAFTAVDSRGIHVDALNPVASAAVPPPMPTPIYHQPPLPQYFPQQVVQQTPARKGVRTWTVLFVVAAIIGAAIAPPIGYWSVGILAVLFVLYLIPPTSGFSRPMLGIGVGRPVATTFKLIFLVFLMGFILLMSFTGQEIRDSAKRREAEQVVAAEERAKLEKEANDKVEKIMVDVRSMVRANNLPGATARVAEAMKVANATNKGEAQRLSDGLALAKDNAGIRSRLLSAPDDQFNIFATGGALPAMLDTDEPVLNRSIEPVARGMVASLKPERVAIAQRKAAEEAQRQREEAARAEADRKERARKDAEAAAVSAAASKEVSDKIDAYLAAIGLDEMGPKLVESVSASRDGKSWRATVTVKNLWHVRNKQLRLQDAQNLWKMWAALTSPTDPDMARIKLVDANGNEVGGSRIIGGSMIWVQD